MGFLNDFANIILGVGVWGGRGWTQARRGRGAFGNHRSITRPRLNDGMRDLNIAQNLWLDRGKTVFSA